MFRTFKLLDSLEKNRNVIYLLVFLFFVAVGATFLIRIGDGGLPIGMVFICSWSDVPVPEFPEVFLTFAIEPIPIYLIFAGGVVYWLLVRQTIPYMQKRKRDQSENMLRNQVAVLVSRRQIICFYIGLATILLTVFGPIAAYDSTFLSLHMVQHLSLIHI